MSRVNQRGGLTGREWAYETAMTRVVCASAASCGSPG
jgi:hypothetical protein